MSQVRKPGLLLLLPLLAAGCGGDHGGSSSPVVDGYPGFGYTDTLYRGTLTADAADGTTVTVPIDLTVSADRTRVAGYHLETSGETRTSARIVSDPAYGTVVNAPLASFGERSGSSSVRARGRDLTIAFTDGEGNTARIEATVDAPPLVPVKPPAGTYAGTNLGRTSLSGVLQFAGPAGGTLADDGTFRFEYTALGFAREGIVAGKIAADGTVSNVEVVRDDSGIGTSGLDVRAYGTADDLTLIFRNTSGETIGETYRLRRTGD